jgi:chemotaxis signal transduction protein
MSAGDAAPQMVVAHLRAEFDRAFTLSPAVAAERPGAFLAIRIGGDPFALRLEQLVGIHVDRKIVPLPSATPTLLGIASFRGALTPVHDLRIVLGYPTRAEARWLVRIAGPTPVGLVFDALEGQFSAQLDDGEDRERQRENARGYTRGVVRALDFLRPVVDVAAVLAALGMSRPAPSPPKER